MNNQNYGYKIVHFDLDIEANSIQSTKNFGQ